MIKTALLLASLGLFLSLAVDAKETRYSLTRADRIEYLAAEEIVLWELQGWYGGDIHKLWWKAEGDAGGGASDEFSVQLLYSRDISPYFDVQFGAALEDHITDQDAALVIGTATVLLLGPGVYDWYLDLFR